MDDAFLPLSKSLWIEQGQNYQQPLINGGITHQIEIYFIPIEFQ